MSDNENIQADFTGQSGERHQHGDRVRVRKRIRVKKKRSPKKKVRKFFERLIWTLVILAFIITLIYLFKELDLTDARYKKKKTTSQVFQQGSDERPFFAEKVRMPVPA